MLLKDEEIPYNFSGEISRPRDILPEDDTQPGFWGTVGAAFRRENLVGSLFSYGIDNPRATNPTFHPFDYIKDTQYEADFKRFAFTDSEQEVNDLKNRIDKEREDSEIINKSGLLGTVSSVAAGILDPTIFLPAVGGAKIIRAGSKMSKIGRGVVAGSATGVLGVGAQEAGLQATQTDRTLTESGLNTLAGAFLGGVLGGGLGAFISKPAKEEAQEYVKSVFKSNTYTPNQKMNMDAGAAATKGEEESITRINKSFFKIFKAIDSPIAKGLNNASKTVQGMTNDMFEHNIRLGKHTEKYGYDSNTTLETYQEMDTAKLLATNSYVRDQYFVYAKKSRGAFKGMRADIAARRGDIMSYDQFSREVDTALRTPGQAHKLPEVQATAKRLRQEVTEKARAMDKLGILDLSKIPEGKLETYVSRIYDADKVLNYRQEFSTIVERSILKEDPNIDPDEVKDIVNNMINNIVGLGDPHGMFTGIGGRISSATKQRVITATDEELEFFLVKDGIGNAMRYIDKADRQIRFQEFLNRNGWENVNDIKKDVASDYDQLVKSGKATVKEATKAQKLVDDFVAIANGQYGVKTGGPSKWDHSLKFLRKYSTATMLGGVTITSLQELAMAPFRAGIWRTVMDGWAPAFRSFSKAKLAKDEWQDVVGAMDIETDAAIRMMVDPDFKQVYDLNRFDKAAEGFMSFYGKATLIAQWTRSGRRIATQVGAAKAIRTLRKGTTSKEKEWLAQYGLGAQWHDRVLKQFNKYGEEHNGSFITNHRAWDDQEAADAFRGFVIKFTNSTILKPGKGDLPQWVQGSDLGKALFQFKSFSAAATNRIFIPLLQERDLAAVSRLSYLLFAGAVTYIAKEKIAGREPNLEFSNLLQQSISRTGMGGIMQDVAFITLPGLHSTRFGDYNRAQWILGPSASQILSAITLLNTASQVAYYNTTGDTLGEEGKKEFSQGDINKAKRLLPFNNLFYLQALSNKYKRKKDK